MGLGPSELPIVMSSLCRSGLSAFPPALPVMVPFTQRGQIGFAVVIAATNVVDVGCGFGTPVAIIVSMSASMAVATKDATAHHRPVRRKPLSPV